MSQSSSRPNLGRRRFLQTAGLAAGSALTPSPMGHAAAPEMEADVLVCGGRCAGLAAALSAARNGAKTLLVERAGFAGGIITTVGLPFFDGIAEPKGNRIVVRGIGLELLSKSVVCAPDATDTK